MDLKELRNELDNIDNEIVELFRRRMETVKMVSESKKDTGKAVKDRRREREILSRVTGLAGKELESYTKVLFTTLMSLSRSYQHSLKGQSELSLQLKSAMDSTDAVFPRKAVVACPGTEDSYSQQACGKLFSLPSIMYCTDFNGVFSAVEKGRCRYGVLPIESITHGSVCEIYDLLRRHNLYIVRSLLSNPSENFSERKNLQTSEQSSEFTRYICIAGKPEIYPDSDRVSFMINLPHEPGSLCGLLSRFAALDINVRKIESRPIHGSDLEFTFCFDIDGNLSSPDVLQLIGELAREDTSFAFLGSYAES